MLYIDADTVFTDDITERMGKIDIGDCIIGALSDSKCGDRHPYEKEALLRCEKAETDPYYGTSIVFINAERFNKGKYVNRIQDSAQRTPQLMLLWDQTALNCAFRPDEIFDVAEVIGSWMQLAPHSGKRTEPFNRGIIHFYGTPKPWDLFGEVFHPCYRIWNEAAKKAGYESNHIKNYFSIEVMRRAWGLRKQYRSWI
jgi:lipopolysaccharide biosynthesis glycosyltransferase